MIIQGMSYLTDPNKQFVTKGGAPNVGGFVRVYLANTDDPAKTYCDFNGTRNPQDIRLDNNGRAVIIADASKAYRIEVCNRFGGLLWTVEPAYCIGGEGGGSGEDIYEIAMFDLSQAGHGLYDDIDANLGAGLLPIIYTGSQGSVRYYYYTARDSQAHTMTFTCGNNGSVELLVLKNDDTYEFTSIAKSALIANKYGTHYVSGTDAGTGLEDGDFLFEDRAKTGEDIWIDDDHKIRCNAGWYHFDFTILIFVNPIDYTHNGGTQPRIDTVHLSAGGYGASVDADLDRCATATYKTSVHISGDFYASSDGYNVGANITGLGYNAYAHVDKMCVHKVSEDE